MAETEPAVASTFLARDLFLFLCAVLVGTTAGIGSQQALLYLTSPQTAASPLRREILYGLSRVFYAASAASW